MNNSNQLLDKKDLNISDEDILKVTIFNEILKNIEFDKENSIFRINFSLALSVEQVTNLQNEINNILINKEL